MVRLRGTHQNSYFWSILASFVCYYSLILGPAVIRMFWEPRGPITWNSSKLAVLAYSRQFCMLLLTEFGSRCDTKVPGTRLRGTRQTSQFWPMPTSFVCYYSLILVAAPIQTFREPRGQVTRNSSKFVLLVYCGQFCMLSLTDFGSRCDPNVLGTPGSDYVELMKTRSFGIFRPVLYATSH